MKAILMLCFFAFFCLANEGCAYIQKHSQDIQSNDTKLAKAIEECDISLQNQNFSKKLYELTNKIRGSNLACSGLSYLEKLRKFQVNLALISMQPSSYVKDTNKKEIQTLKEYFRYWAYQSIGNFRLHREFWKEYELVLAQLQKYAQSKGLDKNKALVYANYVANEFLYWAVGETKIFRDINDFSKFIINPSNNAQQVRAYIYTKQPNKEELESALQAALLAQRPSSVINLFLELGLRINDGYESALFYALENYENVNFLINKGANVNQANSFGKTPLFYAVEFNQKDVVELLLENKANVNAKYISNNEKLAIINNLGGNIPYYITLCALEHTSKNVLMHAASYSDTDILKILVKYGANINETDDMGFNALDFALSTNKDENVKYLQSLGLKANENLYYGGSLE